MNNRIHLILIPVMLVGLGFLSYRMTYALFADSASSTGNTFAAAETFPTGTPSVTPTSTPTSTPTPTPTVSPTPTPTPIPLPTDIANHLVISEVQILGANAAQDFVEIYNPTNSDVDLGEGANWKIRKRIANGTETSLVEFSNGMIIKAHGFFLWSNDENNFNNVVTSDVHNTNNLSENDSIALENPANTIVDQVGWGSGVNKFGEGNSVSNFADVASKSIERKAYSTSTNSTMTGLGLDADKGNGFDTEDNDTNFITRAPSQPQNSSSLIEQP